MTSPNLIVSEWTIPTTNKDEKERLATALMDDGIPARVDNRSIDAMVCTLRQDIGFWQHHPCTQFRPPRKLAINYWTVAYHSFDTFVRTGYGHTGTITRQTAFAAWEIQTRSARDTDRDDATVVEQQEGTIGQEILNGVRGDREESHYMRSKAD